MSWSFVTIKLFLIRPRNWQKTFFFQTDFLFLPDVWRAAAAAAAAAAALVRAAGKRLEPTLATFDFGDTAKLVRFVSYLRYLK